mmetsp:Transcript_99107/g.296152  ORF Transcript_99107/g.296152 Transcript_99107/m.296152 type:complete len:355 (+) Transcript_99107:67-1131(+)
MAEVRWGILGCAGIAQKFAVALAEAKNARVAAVASRSIAKAEAWAAENTPGAKAFGSYEELLADPDVQAVYVPLPTGMRADWVVRAAESGKHVLSEKPLGCTWSDTCRLVEACRKAGVQFMDNTMFMHNERLEEMKSVLKDEKTFGKVTQVVSAFTIPCAQEEEWAKGNIRMKRDTEPLGCLGDLGWYCVRFTLWAFDYDTPESVRCDYLEATDEKVPVRVAGTMRFSGSRTATFDCSFKHCMRQWAEVVGEKASLHVDDFVVPKETSTVSYSVRTGSIADKALTFPGETTTKSLEIGTQQHTQLVERFSKLVEEGTRDDFWPKVALQTQQLMAALDLSAQKCGEWVRPDSLTS